jgi:hypothetical protein
MAKTAVTTPSQVATRSGNVVKLVMPSTDRLNSRP